ncbi:CoF synthetase [Ichthyenterobacterium sp. W332]|uniref:CoF synthetase n=1 Tax=Microcosmobacter mediterraneus TaxID=3075607 RepID=A0ABU2YLN4_9FLAO|nr:CoF synthetase [Ichthyenterobacterium sp. W332]MDT0558735.1 CoF synthetase [Ichthyenterobacterium sp. W332]
MSLNILRNKGFWLFDSIKGGLIRKHLDEIITIQKQPNSVEAVRLKYSYTHKLIKHANKTTTYYKKFKNAKKINDLPVVNKSLIQENFEKFKSQKFINKKTHKVSTSGSTGLSFFIFQNKNKRSRNYADSIYYYDNAAYRLGNRIYKLIVWHNNNRKSRFNSWLLNMYQFDVSNLKDQRIEYLINKLTNDNQKNKTFLCYASALEQIAKYLEKRELFISNHGLNAIIAISEYLNKYTKETLEKHLNIPVYSRYSNEELGMIAQQSISSPTFFEVNHASYHVEILSMDSDKHVKPGEFGRIVVTDLHNYAMPMIRYDTGDIARYKYDNNGVMQLDKIEGRKMDVIYNTSGNIISSFITHAIFNEHYKHLKQYQLIQQGEKDYEIKLNANHSTLSIEGEIINNVKSELGKDANVKITYVEEIPPLASGKRRKVINNYIIN